MPRTHRLAVEIGGTFTDIIVLDSDGVRQGLRSVKVPTTPDRLKRGVLDGVDGLGLDWRGVSDIMHGSTVATNAVLERKGVPTAMLVTEGFRDILEIQRGDKSNIYDIFYRRPFPVVPRQWVMPIRERLDATGAVIHPLDEADVLAVIPKLAAGGIRSVAICFLHSYLNPVHENRARAVIEREAPGILVVTSSEMLPQFREYERASTVAIGAYVAPIMSSYVAELLGEFRERGFAGSLFITQSNGGVLPAGSIRTEAVRTLLSGPAAGVTGALEAASRAGFGDIIAFDMGGTSTDVCLVKDGVPSVTTENTINGLPVAVPMIDIATVGAGGGSIAQVDAHSMLHVGPWSAGADPGPACYGRGGNWPTVTDANVARGIIRARNFAGGTMPLDADASERVLAGLGRQLDMAASEAADAIVQVIEANMIQAIRLVTTQRGHDPRDYVLVAFGGAGPIHAASIAAELGINRVLVPALAGVLSAYGLLVADIARDYVRTAVGLADELTADQMRDRFGELTRRARNEFTAQGFSESELILFPSCDARYQGQAYELSLPLDLADVSSRSIGARFHDVHRRRYGFAFEAGRVEIVNYRLRASVRRRSVGIDVGRERSGPVAVEQGEIRVGDSRRKVNFYRSESITAETSIEGPAVIEDASSTCFTPEGWIAQLVESGGILLRRSTT